MSKYRKDFVTNSSSSSFICDICGAEASGWDMSLYEAEMVRCVNNHLFCEDDMINKSAEWWYEFLQTECDYVYTDPSDLWGMRYEYLREFDGRYRLHPELCPLCQLEAISDRDYMDYMAKILNMSSADALKEITEKFGTYDKFREWLRSKE